MTSKVIMKIILDRKGLSNSGYSDEQMDVEGALEDGSVD
ncbi:MAG: hypothetical protein RI993_1658 [Pseudomonadota bacterium]|jgi:hypothetical protein